MIKRMLFVVIICLVVVGIGTANAASSAGVASQTTVIQGKVHVLLPDISGDIFIEVITKSGNLYGFTEYKKHVFSRNVEIGTPVQIVFIEEVIEGFSFCKPMLRW